MKRYLAIIFLLGISTLAFGQKTLSAVELIGSLDYYSYELSTAVKFSGLDLRNVLNYSVGVSGTIILNERLNGRVGLLYSTKNFDIDFLINRNNPDDPTRARIDNAWLDIPLLLEYQFSQDKPFQVFGVVGFVPGIFLSSNETTAFRGLPEQETERFNSDFKNFVTSFNAGIRFAYTVKNWSMGAHPYIRYYLNETNSELLDVLPYSVGAMVFGSYTF